MSQALEYLPGCSGTVYTAEQSAHLYSITLLNEP